MLIGAERCRTVPKVKPLKGKISPLFAARDFRLRIRRSGVRITPGVPVTSFSLSFNEDTTYPPNQKKPGCAKTVLILSGFRIADAIELTCGLVQSDNSIGKVSMEEGGWMVKNFMYGIK